MIEMIKKTRFIVFVIFLMLLLGMSLIFSFQQASAPVPPNITIEPPDPSLPAEAKLLTGKWAGEWKSPYGWDCVLYVEKLDKDSAQVGLSWGEYNTKKMSCHCEPNWATVQKAKVIYREEKATIEFITPNLQSRNFKKKMHTLSGEDEGWVSSNPRGHGHYDFSFTVEKNEPNIMKGHFISGKGSHLYIEMKKID
jgi:hypothetical protein